MLSGRNTWLFSRKKDLFLLFLPVWASWLVCFQLSEKTLNAEIPIWIWIVFVLGIDVGHVWSTIFRTYLDKEEFSNHRKLLTLTPIFTLIIVTAIVFISIELFWRLLAYFALYHFIKQQYGFLILYKIKSGIHQTKMIFKDKWVLYFSMAIPVFYWHFNSNRNFNWFEDGDFINLKSILLDNNLLTSGSFETINKWISIVYFIVILGWMVEEIYLTLKSNGSFQWGKVLWLLTTASNWYLGIIYFNSDLAFTLTNVIAHGIPYMTLIFHYVERKKQIQAAQYVSTFFKVGIKVLIMLVIVFSLSFGEEYFWDMLLFREKQDFFETLFKYPLAMVSIPVLQAILFGLLSIPQVTHYVIDGFIWKNNKRNPYLKRIIFNFPA